MTHRYTRKTVVIDDCKRNGEWRDAVALFARLAYKGAPLRGPLRLEAIFQLKRPKCHFDSKGNLKPSAPAFPTVKPDATKFLRSTEDALTDAGMWEDDALVVEQLVRKVYAEKFGALITISTVEQQ